jgi:hypothetical protein
MVKRTSLKEIIGTEDEIEFFKTIEKFNCQDKDVEKFLKEKAVEFDKRNKSRTYLLFDTDESNDIVILGYFTVTIKSLKLNPALPKSKIKKIDGFRSDVKETEAVLIGQLGKNQNHKTLIDGKTILKTAIEVIYAAHELVGGRIMFLECANNAKVVEFYEKNDFVFLQENGEYLQMIRYL